MHRPTIDISKVPQAIIRDQISLGCCCSRGEVKMEKPQIKKRSLWERIKSLFIRKFFPKTRKPLYPLALSPLSVSYTTMAGCDVKLRLVYGLGEFATKEEILKGSNYKSLDVAQVITIRTVWEENGLHDVIKSVGSLLCIMFEESIMRKIEAVQGPAHLLCFSRGRSGKSSSFILPNFKVTSWFWGISIDDLISEENLTFEADEPIYWFAS